MWWQCINVIFRRNNVCGGSLALPCCLGLVWSLNWYILCRTSEAVSLGFLTRANCGMIKKLCSACVKSSSFPRFRAPTMTSSAGLTILMKSGNAAAGILEYVRFLWQTAWMRRRLLSVGETSENRSSLKQPRRSSTTLSHGPYSFSSAGNTLRSSASFFSSSSFSSCSSFCSCSCFSST